jgi:hypothetical protein
MIAGESIAVPVRSEETVHPHESEDRYGKLPLRPARPKEKDAREHGYEVIRVTHREAQGSRD